MSKANLCVFYFFKPDLGNNSIDIKPVVKYDNACFDKSKILKENKNKSGVYRWINKLNGKTYIGSSTNLRVRLYKYYSIGSLGNNLRVIDRALFKYGFSSFSFEILEYCDKNIVLEREQYYLGLLGPDYNIVELAGNTLGYKHSEESLERMRNFVMSPFCCFATKGTYISGANVGDDLRAKKAVNVVKYATAANMVPVVVEDIHTKEKTEYNSVREAALALGIHNTTLSYALRNNSIFKKTYTIKRKE